MNEAIALGEALSDLRKNRKFKLVFEDGYFKKEAMRLVLARGSYPSGVDNIQQKEIFQSEIDSAISAIGELNQYLHTIEMMANRAKKAINEDRDIDASNLDNMAG